MEDKERTLYCGNLSEKVTEDLLYELFLQAGPLENVTIPKDKDGRQRNFAFIAFKHPVSVQYSVALMNGISLYGRPLRLDARSGSDEPNTYLQQLQQYTMAATQRNYQTNDSGYYQHNDNRYQQNDNRYRDSRRYESRTDGLMNCPALFNTFVQPQSYLIPQMQLPPVMNAYPYQSPGRYDGYPSSRSGYRR